jgi:chromosome segregation ATPase
MSDKTLSDNLNVTMQAAIAENLPQAVGEELRKRLEQAVKDQEEVERLKDVVEKGSDKNDKLYNENRQLANDLETAHNAIKRYEEREATLAEAERQMAIDQAVLEANKAHVDARVGEMRDVVRDVFSNNRYKYDRSVCRSVVVPPMPGMPGSDNPYMMPVEPQPGRVENVFDTDQITGEGSAS